MILYNAAFQFINPLAHVFSSSLSPPVLRPRGSSPPAVRLSSRPRRQPRCNRNPRHRAHYSFQKKNSTVFCSDSLITHWSAWYMSPPRLPTTAPECTTQPQTESPYPRVNSCPPCPFPRSSFYFQVTMRDGPNTPLLPVNGVKRWALVFWLALPTADAYPISPAGVSCRPTCGQFLVSHLLQL